MKKQKLFKCIKLIDSIVLYTKWKKWIKEEKNLIKNYSVYLTENEMKTLNYALAMNGTGTKYFRY